MSPGPVLGVVDLASPGLVARGTRELGALEEVEPEIEPPFFLGELEIDDPLGLSDIENQGKQAEFIHRDVSFRNLDPSRILSYPKAPFKPVQPILNGRELKIFFQLG